MLMPSSVSLFYLVGLFDLWSGIRTMLISAGGAYLISAKINSPYMPWIGFVFLMGHMSVNHIYRQILNDPSVVDITGAQMVMIMKACPPLIIMHLSLTFVVNCLLLERTRRSPARL